MVTPIPFAGYNDSNKFLDYQKLDQQFQMQKAAAAQALQGGEIDQQAKKLNLLGQIVGTNSVDQSSYDRARQVAAQQGLDVSALPEQFNPDVVNRLRFAGATPTAQLSALIASQGHDLKAGIAAGNVGAYGFNGSNGAGGNAPVAGGAPSIVSTAPRTTGNMAPADQAAAVTDLYGDNQPAPSNTAQPVVITRDQAPPQPTQRQGETTQAFNARIDAWKADPAVQAQQEKAKDIGKAQGAAETGNIAASEAYGRLTKNLDALEQLNAKLPGPGVASPETKAWLDKRTGGVLGSGADVLGPWNEINQQQALNALQDLVKQGGGQLRSNMLIDKMIARGYIVDPDQPAAARQQEIDILRNELKNIDTSGKNINARLNGGNAQEYSATLPQQPVSQIDPKTPEYAETIFNAKKAISAGKDPAVIKQRLQAAGINPADAGL